MQKVDIIAVGHLKEKYLKDAENEYRKRLSSLCRLNITEIEPERLPDSPKESEISAALEREADRIFAALPQHCFAVPLCIEGDMADSVGLSQRSSANLPSVEKAGSALSSAALTVCPNA